MIELLSHIAYFFNKGGLVMYPLLICSVIVVSIAIDRYLYFRHAQTDVKTLLGAVDSPLRQADWNGAVAIAAQTPGIAASMLAKGLELPFEDRLQLEQNLDGAATLAATELNDRLDFLDTIVTLAPLLGLLGTVTGMIQSFSVLTLKAGQPLAITGGVGEALIATATGLCVAILALISHSYFSYRINAVVTDMERVANYVLGAAPRRASHEAK
jgi:biopolymer transport protein ExbB